MKRIAVIAFLTLAAAGWLSRAAALQVYVSAQWDSDKTEHLNNNSIVQVILYNSDPDAHSVSPGDPDSPQAGDNFQPYGEHYLANTTLEGNLIVYEGHITKNSNGTAEFGHWVDIPNSLLAVYDKIYIRVFEATEFTEGTATESWWGISEPDDLSGSAGTGNTWFENTELNQQNIFEVIPEPSTLALFCLGMGGLGGAAVKRKKRRARLASAQQERV